MSDNVEISPGVAVNRDNINHFKKNIAKNGGTPTLIIAYTDTTDRTYLMENHHQLNAAYTKLLKK